MKKENIVHLTLMSNGDYKATTEDDLDFIEDSETILIEDMRLDILTQDQILAEPEVNEIASNILKRQIKGRVIFEFDKDNFDYIFDYIESFNKDNV